MGPAEREARGSYPGGGTHDNSTRNGGWAGPSSPLRHRGPGRIVTRGAADEQRVTDNVGEEANDEGEEKEIINTYGTYAGGEVLRNYKTKEQNPGKHEETNDEPNGGISACHEW